MQSLKKVTKVTPQWNAVKGVINVKFSPNSGWFKFGGVNESGDMFILIDRKGEQMFSNVIYVAAA